MSVVRVRFTAGPLTHGREPDTGSPGRSAKARCPTGHEGSIPSPSAGNEKRKTKNAKGKKAALPTFSFCVFRFALPALVVKRSHHSALRTRRSRFESWPGH